MGRALSGGFGSAVGYGVAAGVLNAGDQNACGLPGGGQFTLGGGLLEELVGFVAAGLGVGEDGGQSGPGRVCEDTVGVVRNGGADIAGQGAPGLFLRPTALQFDELGDESLVGGGLEVLQSPARGVGLVGVLLRLVPATGQDGRPHECGEQGGQRAAVRASSGVDDVAGGDAYGVGCSVLGLDLGSLGAKERLRRSVEARPP